MTSFRVEPGGLSTMSAQLAPAQAALAAIAIPGPNPGMYGVLVGSAATDAEPVTTTHLNDLAHALGDLYGSISSRLTESGRCYAQVEDANTTLAHEITRALA
jgi:hypothetical protein